MRPEIVAGSHGFGAFVRVVQDHNGRPSFRGVVHPVMQGTVYMHIAEAIAANKDRVGLIDMSDQGCVIRVERFDQELIQL